MLARGAGVHLIERILTDLTVNRIAGLFYEIRARPLALMRLEFGRRTRHSSDVEFYISTFTAVA